MRFNLLFQSPWIWDCHRCTPLGGSVRIPILVSLRCDDHTLRGPRPSGEETKLSPSVHRLLLLAADAIRPALQGLALCHHALPVMRDC